LVVNLEHDCEVVPWTTVFGASDYTLEALESNLDRFDFAVLVMSADDLIERRDARGRVPRDNVLVELGISLGKLGRKRTVMVADRSRDMILPTDLDGVTLATYMPHRSGNYHAALAPACVKIK